MENKSEGPAERLRAALDLFELALAMLRTRLLRENPEIELILKWSASRLVRSNQSTELFWDSIRNDGFKLFRIDDERPGQLVALQGVATVPDTASLLLTRKREPCALLS